MTREKKNPDTCALYRPCHVHNSRSQGDNVVMYNHQIVGGGNSTDSETGLTSHYNFATASDVTAGT